MKEDQEKAGLWQKTVSKWSGAIAAGGGQVLRVFITRPGKRHQSLLRVSLPDAC